MKFLLLSPTGKKHEIKETCVFLPGWGFDGWSSLLFQPLKDRDLVIPSSTITPDVFTVLNYYLEELGIERIHLIGWSMGANLALDYVFNNREKIVSLTLAGMRRSWPVTVIKDIRENLLKEPEKFMQDFYRKCFLGSRKTYKQFISEFQERYLADLDLDILMAGLTYLENYCFEPVPRLTDINVKVLHGIKDIIAPVAEKPVFSMDYEDRLFPGLGHAVLSGEDVIL